MELAFTGAEGAGAHSQGGRGGPTLLVDSLNSSGAGTLRAAIDTSGPRIIEFDPTMHGEIRLNSALEIEDPFVTIRGQTAGGAGICLRDNRMIIRTHNVIVQYLRFRLGDEITLAPNVSNSLFINHNDNQNPGADGDVHDVIIDHCTISWCMDTNLGIWNSSWNEHNAGANAGIDVIRNVTISHCILSEPQRNSQHPESPHPFNLLVGGGCDQISIIKNVFILATNRNPQVKGGKVEIGNNIFYGCTGHVTRVASDNSGVDPALINYINNKAIQRPGEPEPNHMFILIDETKAHQVHLNGNESKDRPNANSGDEYDMASTSFGSPSAVQGQHKRSTPHILDGEVPTYVSASDLHSDTAILLAHAGCAKPLRDSRDKDLIDFVIASSGGTLAIDTPADAGGYPDLSTGTPTPDWPATSGPGNPPDPPSAPEAPIQPIPAGFFRRY